MGQGESSFYPVHGHNVYLRDNGSLVERATDSRSHAVVFTRRPLELSGLFQVRMLKREDKKRTVASQVIIGITTRNPSSIKNLSACSSIYELQHTASNDHDSKYWCVEFTSSIKSKSTHDLHQQKKEIPLAENDTVGLMMTKSGYVHLLVNGVDHEVLWNDLPTDRSLWGILELTGVITCIKAEYKNISGVTLQQEELASLGPNFSPKLSSIQRPLPPIPPDETSHNDSPPVPPPRSPSPIPSSLTFPRSPVANRHFVDTTNTIGSPKSAMRKGITELTLPSNKDRGRKSAHQLDSPARLQEAVTEQLRQILQLEKERDKSRQTANDLQQQVEILRKQLTQMRKSSQAETSKDATADISFWEITSNDLKIQEEVIGRGGWGEVKVGYFRGTKVAVKQLYPEILSPHYVTLIRREINLMAKVRHPNLVLFMAAVLDHASGSPMIVLELLDTSLRKAYQENKLSTLSIKLSIMRDVAAALNYLHQLSQPIVHRDVSSANVLLELVAENKWKGKLSDFGSANLARHAVTAAPGAEAYTAPEVPRSTLNASLTVEVKQTVKIDVYSYGVLLCEVVSGEFPLQEAFQRMLQNVSAQSSIVRQLVDSCIDTDPTVRPTMDSVLEQIGELLLQN